ncbi:MAG: hypothetical protein ACFFD4_26910 [Candidatus Odinarchaeota archaeon]
MIEDNDAIEDMVWNMFYYEQQCLPAFKKSVSSLQKLRILEHSVVEKDLRENERVKKVQRPPMLVCG